ncbi:hypothetical protein HJC23_008838 [Cyclotella cryptica]|uniref:Glucose-methanol-choline oxidoreductase N-terminal domain-containing protein n=1 Tax=Cyclotella cryptica TaxID=29204 RepID=A0ABD3Q9S8_9STRA|eukprot:CCRYP_007499-RA/>CCRYP_007499-RA protein AED:0.12 eAED:0.12 QI:0/-1/0/1/-1/1/1/0/709
MDRRTPWTYNTMDPLEYDIIIIGAGPSAAGLLHGILSQIKRKAINSNHVRIAVVERGETVRGETPPTFRHDHESTIHLQDWFAAAHYASSCAAADRRISSPTTLHASAPQRHLHSRILDVPTGRGWGGSTNIHAGLMVPPSEEDFQSWPGMWRDRMMHAVNHVIGVFQTEGILSQSPGAPLGNGETCNVANFEGAPFEPTTTTSFQSKRVNYFTALVYPLLRDHPELRQAVTFLSGMEAQRILFDNENNDNPTEHTLASCKREKTHAPRAWGVECLVLSDDLTTNKNSDRLAKSYNRRHVILKSTCEIILCAGAIGSPALLLVSGIGHPEDLRDAGISPLLDYDQEARHGDEMSQTERDAAKNIHSNLPVGRNLRDHVLVPRIFLTPKQEEARMSCNSIRGWWTIQRQIGRNESGIHHDYAKFQLQLADGASIDKMMPHFAAGAMRRRWTLLNLGWDIHRATISHIFRFLRGVLHGAFFIIPVLSPLLKSWIRSHFAFVNVCLMNPKSVGKVTLLSRRNQDDDRESRHDSTSLDLSTVRLSGFEVVIDPGYLSNPWDMSALWKGWEISSALKSGPYEECAEILPGVLFVAAVKIANLVSLMLRWTHMFLFGPERKRDTQEMTLSAAPTWFCSYVAEFANPYYHWYGTCVLGPLKTNQNDDNFVVDECLFVRGVSSLRVCDSSVFPYSVTVPTALTCAALGFATSTFIVC